MELALVMLRRSQSIRVQTMMTEGMMVTKINFKSKQTSLKWLSLSSDRQVIRWAKNPEKPDKVSPRMNCLETSAKLNCEGDIRHNDLLGLQHPRGRSRVGLLGSPNKSADACDQKEL